MTQLSCLKLYQLRLFIQVNVLLSLLFYFFKRTSTLSLFFKRTSELHYCFITFLNVLPEFKQLQYQFRSPN